MLFSDAQMIRSLERRCAAKIRPVLSGADAWPIIGLLSSRD
jgi:hypothetical protein